MGSACLNKDGKPEAYNLKPWGGGGGWGGKQFKVDNSGGELGEFTGTIKSFGFNKNYGFIECDELAEHDGVFLHGDERRGYQLGDKVKFSACLNKDGKPEAYNLKVCGGGGGWGGKQF